MQSFYGGQSSVFLYMGKKFEALQKILKELGKPVIAFSGGVDSAVLLKIAAGTLGKENVVAVTAVSPTYTGEEKREAVKIAKSFGVRHILAETEEFRDKNFVSNTPERCFFCKKELFEKLEEIRRQNGFDYIADGTNKDDEKDFRPGEKAKKLYPVRSPLREAAITKKEIRLYAKNAGLSYWNKPSMACLASRIPYGRKITPAGIERISEGERFLKKLGFTEVRLRDYGDTARIEVARGEMGNALRMGDRISKRMKKLGYTYVTLDLEGFRSGSMNRALEKKGGT